LWNWFVGLVSIGKPECQNLARHRVLLLNPLRILAQHSGSGFKAKTQSQIFYL
jgi:hypothetical protein